MKEKLIGSSDGNVTRREFLERAAVTGVTLAVLGGTTKSEVAGQTIKSTTVTKPGAPPNWGLLQKNVLGDVVLNNSPEYESRRRSMVWNAVKAERFPGAIVRVRSEADVSETIRFARTNQLKVAIRGGGHNWHNAAIRQGGVLLDLSRLNQIQVDVEKRKAVVQPGVKGAAFIANLAPHGLAFPIGHSPKVGLSGFLLSGGVGWNYGNWGPSCASIEALDIVDARGKLIRADHDQNADLLWAARGAGPGFFGVVTRIHLKVFPLPRAILRSRLVYPIEDFDKVAAWLPEIVRSVPAELRFGFYNRKIVIQAWAFADTVADARSALQALEAEPTGLHAQRKRLYAELSVEELFGAVNEGSGPGPRYAGDGVWSNASPQELLSGVRDGILAAPSESCWVEFHLLQGRGWPQLPDMAFSVFASSHVGVYSIWNDAEQDTANQAWVRSTIASLEPLKVGYYVGESDLTVAPNRAQQCFSPAAWGKLIKLKRKYDPHNVFFSYLQHP
ncbi:MAG: FAD-binding oxidoreductase [Acidobacteriota bacterium]